MESGRLVLDESPDVERHMLLAQRRAVRADLRSSEEVGGLEAPDSHDL